MKWLQNDFKTSQKNDSWYDLEEDWSLIESSLAKQYGIRIRSEKDMPWTEFVSLISGLMPDTPLGQIVTIRSEQDPKIIKNFTADQRRIHSDWVKRQTALKLEDKGELKKSEDNLEKVIATLFREGVNV